MGQLYLNSKENNNISSQEWIRILLAKEMAGGEHAQQKGNEGQRHLHKRTQEAFWK